MNDKVPVNDASDQHKDMTNRERANLCTLIRRREKLAKTAAAQRAAELRADFEKQLGAIYSFDQDATWRKAVEIADRAAREANKLIADRCVELGVPKEFAPCLSDGGWYCRGQNASRERRVELRMMAATRIAAMQKAALTEIETKSVLLQTEVVAGSLSSAAAKTFLDRLPSVEILMVPVDAQTLLKKISRRDPQE